MILPVAAFTMGLLRHMGPHTCNLWHAWTGTTIIFVSKDVTSCGRSLQTQAIATLYPVP